MEEEDETTQQKEEEYNNTHLAVGGQSIKENTAYNSCFPRMHGHFSSGPGVFRSVSFMTSTISNPIHSYTYLHAVFFDTRTMGL